MQLSDDSLRYGAVSQALHWITVGLVIVLFCSRAKWETSSLMSPGALCSCGTVLSVSSCLLFAGARIMWGLFSQAPAPPAEMTRLSPVLARSMHVSLYALLLALPLSGWLAASAEGASVNFFWHSSAACRREEGKNEVFEEAHEILGNVLLILASLHTLAALKHQFIDRDELLRAHAPATGEPRGVAI